VLSLVSITIAVVILSVYNRRHGSKASAVEDFARFEI
jgi:hypothetical protein